MPRFAHTENGYALDCQDAPDSAVYRARFNPGVTHGWQVEKVEDDTIDGATPKPGGGWLNPAPAPGPAPKPLELSGVAFHTLCALAIAQANGTTSQQGMARMGDILAALDGKGGLLRIAANRYVAASGPGGRFSLADTTTLLQALVAAGHATAPEATAIIAGWPRG